MLVSTHEKCLKDDALPSNLNLGSVLVQTQINRTFVHIIIDFNYSSSRQAQAHRINKS